MAYIVWSGMSQIGTTDKKGNRIGAGDPIMLMATKAKSPKKANGKTGDMWQMYILRADIKPTAAVASGADTAICGTCPHRGTTCYTYGTTIVGADGMFSAHTAGRSLSFTPELVRDGLIRFGAYGDPAAVPWEVWEPMVKVARGWTGYTHRWQTCDPRFKTILMASCDSVADMHAATALGWRCYTVLPVGTEKVAGAVPCPSPRIKCASCLKCSGTGLGRRGNVSIVAHGARAKKFTGGITVGKSLPLAVA